jgi:hypothetical protein
MPGREEEGDGGEGSNRDKEQTECHRRSRSSPTHRGSAAGHKKAFGDSAGSPGDLGVTTSCRTCACNRARLRGSRLAYRRYDFATLRRNPTNARRLSCARRGLATSAATWQAQPMTSEPTSLRRHSSLARSTQFTPDSPVEGDGFEPSVPRKRTLFETALFELALPMLREGPRL